MDWTKIYLDTFIPELPQLLNSNFEAFQRYLDVFFDESRGILIKPLETTGRVKGARGEFVTAVVDNLVVKNQFTNLYENNTTADGNYYTMFIESAFVPRDPCTFGIDTSVWTFPYEPSTYKVIDVNKPYYKITNEYPIFLANKNISQVVGIFFSDASGSDDFEILLDPCLGSTFAVDASSSGSGYMEFIATAYDASWGSTWTQYKYGADDSSSGGTGGGTVGPGTIDYIPRFDTINTIADSALYMDGDKLIAQEIQINNAILDSSNNILLGYGSPVQLNSPESERDVSIYGNVNINSNLNVGENLTVDGSIYGPVNIDGSLYVNGNELGVYNPSLPDDLKTPEAVGGIPADTSVGYLRGKTYEAIINDLLFPTVLASIATANSATLNGVSTSTLEVGLPMTPAATGIYNPGVIDNGDGTTGPNLTGDANSYTFFLPDGTVDGTYATAGNSQGHTFSSYNIGFGTNRWEVSIGYDSNSSPYYDNKGNLGSNLDPQRVSGENTDYSNVVTGRRYAWRGTGAPIPTISSQVRALSLKSFLSATNTGTFDITIPGSTPEVYFFIPAGKTVVVQYVESSFADVTGSFTSGPISVDDAGGATQSYESWTTTIGGGGYPGTATYRVTIT